MLPQRCRLHAAPFSHDDFVEKQTGLVDFGKRGEMGMMIDGSSSSIQRMPWPIHYTIYIHYSCEVVGFLIVLGM